MQHFLSMADLSRQQLQHVLDVAFHLRQQRASSTPNDPVLAYKTLLLLFEKPSLRTRLSFEQAMLEQGGRAIAMSGAEVGIGTREAAADIAQVASGMIHGICARVYEHAKLVDMAKHSSVPVINALSDESHPCQALADAMTLMDEFGRELSGRTIAFVGDGNNVARSLCILCAMLSMKFILAAPTGYELKPQFIEQLRQKMPGLRLESTADPFESVRSADAIYTDTWVSMGQEEDSSQRRADFDGYQVNDRLVEAAQEHTIVMHCLPAYRNVEITDEVMDGSRSRVMAQAHNRLHGQKGLLSVLMAGT